MDMKPEWINASEVMASPPKEANDQPDPGELEGPAEPVDGGDQPTPKKKITFHQKVTLVSAILATFANTVAFSIIAVFFPVEAEARGMSQTVIGLLFSSYAFSLAIGSPIWEKVIPLIGARFVFLAGAFVTGGCNILFGFVIEMPSLATFTAFSFIIRLLEGLGTSACSTAASAIVANAFPDNVGTVLSMIEMAIGLSFALGPAIGGFLYKAGGFKLPFFTLGSVVLLIDAVNYFLMPQQGLNDEKAGSMIKLLRIPAVWVALLAVFMQTVSMSSNDATLSLHLKELHFTVLETSLLFVALGLSYSLFAVVCGAVADAFKKATRIMIAMGMFGTALFFFLLGPTPLLNIPSTKLLAILVLPFGGFALALGIVPTLVDIFSSAESYGLSSGLGLSSMVSGLWMGAYSMGAMTGPLIGSALVDSVGYANASTYLGGSCLVAMIIVSLFGVWEYRCGKGRRLPRERLSTEAERRPLLKTSDV